MVKYLSYAGFTKDTPYPAITGELWGVFCEYSWENWPRYNGSALNFCSPCTVWYKCIFVIPCVYVLSSFTLTILCTINSLRPRQNGCHFPDNIFKYISFNENIWLSDDISLKWVPQGLIDNLSLLVQIMAWRQIGDKPLSEPMMV